MSRGVSKGKRKASPAVSDDDVSPRRTRASKKTRHTAGVAAGPSKGIAGFTALLRGSRLSSAASTETNAGRRGRQVASSSRKTNNGKLTVDPDDAPFTVGTIIFITVGIAMNETSDTATFQPLPLYRLRSPVDIRPPALTAMIQCGLGIRRNAGYQFHANDSYADCEALLRSLFPRVFQWLDSTEDDDTPTSSWLVCSKLSYGKGLMVASSNQLPNGFDIISAVGQWKSGHAELTREPVPDSVLLQWRPRTYAQSSTGTSRINLDNGSDNNSHGTASDDSGSSNSDSEDRIEVEAEVIEIDSDSDGSVEPQVATPITVTAPPVHPSTPPHRDPPINLFSLSMTLDDKENPWH